MVNLSALLVIIGLAYLIYFRPLFEEKRDALIFDNRVLSFVDGLYAAGTDFGCTDSYIRNYVQTLLDKAHSLHGNEILLKYSTTRGRYFSSHIGLHGEHMVFALLCIIQYAHEYNNMELVLQCESMLVNAEGSAVHYH